MSRPGAGRRASAEHQWAECAARAVGWRGDVRGLAEFGGVRFYPVLGDPIRFGPPGSGWLTGCVVMCTDPYVGLHEASLLAGYSRRLIAVHTPPPPRRLPTATAAASSTDDRRVGVYDVVDVQLQAALLDQGVVTQAVTTARPEGEQRDGCGCAVLSWPGEVVASPLQRDNRWRADRRWRAFYKTVIAAPAYRRADRGSA